MGRFPRARRRLDDRNGGPRCAELQGRGDRQARIDQPGLLVIKENETFIITGNSPTTFTPKKLEDDGTLSGMSVQQWGGGVIWAGREGIHIYDGIQVRSGGR